MLAACRAHAPLRGEGLGYLDTKSYQSLIVGCCCFSVVFIPCHIWLSSVMKKAPRQRDFRVWPLDSGNAQKWWGLVGGWGGSGRASTPPVTAPSPPSVKWEGCPPWWLSSLLTSKACHCHDVVLVHNALTTLCFHSWFLFSNKMPVPGAGIFIQLDNSFAEKISIILQVIYWKTVLTVLWSPKKSWIINSSLMNEWFLFEYLHHSAMKS